MNPFLYIKNVVTGRYRHWNTEQEPVALQLLYRARELPSVERAVLLSAVVASAQVVDQLLGPNAGKNRVLKTKTRLLRKEEFFHIYFVITAALLAIFVHGNKIVQGRRPLEVAFGHLFHHDPATDEFYCRFLDKLASPDGPSSAFMYQYKEILRFTGAPYTAKIDDFGGHLLFLVVMNAGIKTMTQLVKAKAGEIEA